MPVLTDWMFNFSIKKICNQKQLWWFLLQQLICYDWIFLWIGAIFLVGQFPFCWTSILNIYLFKFLFHYVGVCWELRERCTFKKTQLSNFARASKGIEMTVSAFCTLNCKSSERKWSSIWSERNLYGHSWQKKWP